MGYKKEKVDGECYMWEFQHCTALIFKFIQNFFWKKLKIL